MLKLNSRISTQIDGEYSLLNSRRGSFCEIGTFGLEVYMYGIPNTRHNGISMGFTNLSFEFCYQLIINDPVKEAN